MQRLFLTVILAIVALVSVLAKDTATENRQLYIYEEQLNETLKNLSIKLAAYDPYYIKKININFEHELGYVDYDVEEIRVNGFSKFWATNLKITMDPPSMTFDIQFEELHIMAPYYKIDALALFIPFYGSGFMNLRATVINLGGSAKVIMGDGGISSIENVKARFNLEKSNLIVSGLLHNEPMSEIVSTATTECFPEFVNTYGERLGLLVGNAIETIINNALNPSLAVDSVISSSGQYSDTFEFENGTFKYYYEL